MADKSEDDDKQFHGWRLLGIIVCVIALLALVSAAVDWFVLH